MLPGQLDSGKKQTGVEGECNQDEVKNDNNKKARANLRLPKTPPVKKKIPVVTPKMEYSKKRTGEIKRRHNMANEIARQLCRDKSEKSGDYVPLKCSGWFQKFSCKCITARYDKDPCHRYGVDIMIGDCITYVRGWGWVHTECPYRH